MGLWSPGCCEPVGIKTSRDRYGERGSRVHEGSAVGGVPVHDVFGEGKAADMDGGLHKKGQPAHAGWPFHGPVLSAA